MLLKTPMKINAQTHELMMRFFIYDHFNSQVIHIYVLNMTLNEFR